MHFKFSNVNEAFYTLVQGIHTGEISTVRTTSRNGDVLQVDEPVIISYQRPTQRVLLDPNRDANCFMHLFEAIWMLAGSNKLAPVAFFTPGMKNYSDDGVTFNGAYGYRWRNAEDYSGFYAFENDKRIDQLTLLIDHLSKTPDSRRAVLQMWNFKDDLLKIGGRVCTECSGSGCQWCNTTGVEPDSYSKDVCCNLSVCFSIHNCEKDYNNDGDCHLHKEGCPRYLDMTVFNRSNDLILGCLGANVVHFSFLQEYMACALGVEVGVYNQVSNNLHVYCNNWEPEKWLKGAEHANCYPNLYDGPLFEDREQFDRECQNLVAVFNHPDAATERRYIASYLAGMQLKERFLLQVVRPMCIAFCYHKLREYVDANYWLGLVAAPDWQRVGTEWVQRRQAKWQQKHGEV